MKTLPGAMWGQPPRQELALLRIPLARFYGQKLLFACTGLLIVPGLASLLIGVALWFWHASRRKSAG